MSWAAAAGRGFCMPCRSKFKITRVFCIQAPFKFSQAPSSFRACPHPPLYFSSHTSSLPRKNKAKMKKRTFKKQRVLKSISVCSEHARVAQPCHLPSACLADSSTIALATVEALVKAGPSSLPHLFQPFPTISSLFQPPPSPLLKCRPFWRFGRQTIAG
jgi:hypothetical protein